MELIVAVYEDWGIGADGTQGITLSADRRFFREQTGGACVIVGRRTLADLPGGRPLKGRRNIVLTHGTAEIEGAELASSPAQAAELAKSSKRCFVIGGESIYRQMLAYCGSAYVTKLRCKPLSDRFFPDLDASPEWELSEVVQRGEEQGISYEICLYRRKNEAKNGL